MNTGLSRLDLIQKLYDQLFSSGTTLSKCKDAVIAEKLYSGPTDSMNVAGRSLAWKLFLSKEEPLQASLPPRSTTLLESIRDYRRKYSELLEERSKAPDAKGSAFQASSIAPLERTGNLDLINPLSLHNENPWNEWFASVELRKVIYQDVERTFPDIPFFRESDVQAELTNILFLYSTSNPVIGYRQGMHELLAPLYYAVHFDSITDEESMDSRYSDIAELCSVHHIAADAWSLFLFVMTGVSQWYEWQEPSGLSTKNPQSHFANHVVIPHGQPGVRPYVAPIVQACNHIQNDLLQSCDPILWQSMQKAGIEPQIYGFVG